MGLFLPKYICELFCFCYCVENKQYDAKWGKNSISKKFANVLLGCFEQISCELFNFCLNTVVENQGVAIVKNSKSSRKSEKEQKCKIFAKILLCWCTVQCNEKWTFCGIFCLRRNEKKCTFAKILGAVSLRAETELFDMLTHFGVIWLNNTNHWFWDWTAPFH